MSRAWLSSLIARICCPKPYTAILLDIHLNDFIPSEHLCFWTLEINVQSAPTKDMWVCYRQYNLETSDLICQVPEACHICVSYIVRYTELVHISFAKSDADEAQTKYSPHCPDNFEGVSIYGKTIDGQMRIQTTRVDGTSWTTAALLGKEGLCEEDMIIDSSVKILPASCEHNFAGLGVQLHTRLASASTLSCKLSLLHRLELPADTEIV